jgi:hypothetical protein
MSNESPERTRRLAIARKRIICITCDAPKSSKTAVAWQKFSKSLGQVHCITYVSLGILLNSLAFYWLCMTMVSMTPRRVREKQQGKAGNDFHVWRAEEDVSAQSRDTRRSYGGRGWWRVGHGDVHGRVVETGGRAMRCG